MVSSRDLGQRLRELALGPNGLGGIRKLQSKCMNLSKFPSPSKDTVIYICKMGIIMAPTSSDLVRIKQDNACKVLSPVPDTVTAPKQELLVSGQCFTALHPRPGGWWGLIHSLEGATGRGAGGGGRGGEQCACRTTLGCALSKGSCDHFPFATNPKKTCLIDTGDDEEGTDGNRGSSS